MVYFSTFGFKKWIHLQTRQSEVDLNLNYIIEQFGTNKYDVSEAEMFTDEIMSQSFLLVTFRPSSLPDALLEVVTLVKLSWFWTC